jgi:hypothetical protein
MCTSRTVAFERMDMDNSFTIDTKRFARCVAASKRVRWDIHADVIRGRSFEVTHKFLPDGLTLAPELPWLTERERRYLSQVQGRTYANMFGLVERSSMPRLLKPAVITRGAIRSRWRRLSASATRSGSTRSCFVTLRRSLPRRWCRATVLPWGPNAAPVVLKKSGWAVQARC